MKQKNQCARRQPAFSNPILTGKSSAKETRKISRVFLTPRSPHQLVQHCVCTDFLHTKSRKLRLIFYFPIFSSSLKSCETGKNLESIFRVVRADQPRSLSYVCFTSIFKLSFSCEWNNPFPGFPLFLVRKSWGTIRQEVFLFLPTWNVLGSEVFFR